MKAPLLLLSLLAIAPATSAQQPPQLARFEPTDGLDRLGAAVAVSGNIAVVGAPHDESKVTESLLDVGTAYIFNLATGQQIAALVPDVVSDGLYYGSSVAISGNVVAVGMPSFPTLRGYCYLHKANTGAQLHRLGPGDGNFGDRFGTSVAIDGGTVLVGSPFHDAGGFDAGAAYVFDVNSGNLLHKLLASDAAATDHFGAGVALGGGLAVIGAWSDDDNGADSGSVYVFDAVTGAQLMKLLPSDGAAGDRFGTVVATDGTRILASSVNDADNGLDSGSAYLFDAGTGAQLAKLLPSDGAAGDLFGYSVALDGARAVVGAWGDDDNGPNSGSVYFFDASSGAQLAKFVAPDGHGGDLLGIAVAIRGGVALVGAVGVDGALLGDEDVGAAYALDATTYSQTRKLLASDEPGRQFFGEAVAIGGTTALVGARGDHVYGTHTGSAYLFDTSTGAGIAKLLPPPGAITGSFDEFGVAVAVRGNMAAVGMTSYSIPGPDAGTVFLYDATNGLLTGQLSASDAAADHEFGSALAVRGARLLVGAPGNSSSFGFAGAAYVFDTSTHSQVLELVPPPGEGSGFGTDVALTSSVALVGAPYDNEVGSVTGAAYVFDVTSGAQLAKLLPDGPSAYRFGTFVAVDDDVAVVADHYDVYLFDTATGTGRGKLLLDDCDPGAPGAGCFYPRRVALRGDVIAVGSERDYSYASGAGSVSFFDKWTGVRVGKASPVHGHQGDDFGGAVALTGSTALVGEPNRSNMFGAAYAYSLAGFHAGTARCFCDAAAAPCSNPDPLGGCANSTGVGAALVATGSTSIAEQASDPLVLRASRARPNKGYVWLQGGSQQQVAFKDGLLCVGNPTLRLPGNGCGAFPIGTFDSSGAIATDDPVYGFDVVAAALCKGDDIAAAAPTTRDYQVWFRDGMGPCGTGYNLSNAVTIAWVP